MCTNKGREKLDDGLYVGAQDATGAHVATGAPRPMNAL